MLEHGMLAMSSKLHFLEAIINRFDAIYLYSENDSSLKQANIG